MKKATVLLVEDVPMIQTVHQQLLHALECEVDSAANGRIALTLYLKNKYDLIFLDIELPDMSGITICQFIRDRKDQIPIVALTTNGVELRETCLNAGMNGFIQKPADKQTLRGILTYWIGTY